MYSSERILQLFAGINGYFKGTHDLDKYGYAAPWVKLKKGSAQSSAAKRIYDTFLNEPECIMFLSSVCYHTKPTWIRDIIEDLETNKEIYRHSKRIRCAPTYHAVEQFKELLAVHDFADVCSDPSILYKNKLICDESIAILCNSINLLTLLRIRDNDYLEKHFQRLSKYRVFYPLAPMQIYEIRQQCKNAINRNNP